MQKQNEKTVRYKKNEKKIVYNISKVLKQDKNRDKIIKTIIVIRKVFSTSIQIKIESKECLLK